MKERRWLKRSRDQQGQGLVEFAFAIPILLIVVCGVLEFGIIFFNQITLSNAATDAARYGALHGLSTAQADQAAISRAQRDVSGSDALIQCPMAAQSPAASETPNPGQMTVTVKCSYQFITPVGSLARLFGGSLSGSFTLQATGLQQLEP